MSSLVLTREYIKKPNFIKYLLPLFLLGWDGNSVSWISHVFNSTARWLILAILILFLFTKNILRYFDAKLAFLLFIYLGWCLLTTLWATIPSVSFIRCSTFVVISLTLICAGIEWMKAHSWIKSLDFLWVLSFISLLYGLSGHYTFINHNYNGGNTLGVMMACSFPFFLWKTIRKEEKMIRLIWLFSSICIFYFIFISGARSAMLAANLIFLGYLFSLNLTKKVWLCISFIIILCCVFIINPSVLIRTIEISQSFIFKGNISDNYSAVFGSRLGKWHLSYQGAEKGGWAGSGFGLSFDNDYVYDDNLLRALASTREMGNSQLAIVEQTGLIGLFFYLTLMIYILSRIINLHMKVKDRNQKILIGILTGTFLGMIAESIFEGWWSAPCSAETIYFWVLVGIIRGVDISLTSTHVLDNTTENFKSRF